MADSRPRNERGKTVILHAALSAARRPTLQSGEALGKLTAHGLTAQIQSPGACQAIRLSGILPYILKDQMGRVQSLRSQSNFRRKEHRDSEPPSLRHLPQTAARSALFSAAVAKRRTESREARPSPFPPARDWAVTQPAADPSTDNSSRKCRSLSSDVIVDPGSPSR